MKNIFYVLLMTVLAAALILTGCGQVNSNAQSSVSQAESSMIDDGKVEDNGAEDGVIDKDTSSDGTDTVPDTDTDTGGLGEDIEDGLDKIEEGLGGETSDNKNNTAGNDFLDGSQPDTAR